MRHHTAEAGHTLPWQRSCEEGWHEPHWPLPCSLREAHGCSKARHSEAKERNIFYDLEQVGENGLECLSPPRENDAHSQGRNE